MPRAPGVFTWPLVKVTEGPCGLWWEEAGSCCNAAVGEDFEEVLGGWVLGGRGGEAGAWRLRAGPASALWGEVAGWAEACVPACFVPSCV